MTRLLFSRNRLMHPTPLDEQAGRYRIAETTAEINGPDWVHTRDYLTPNRESWSHSSIGAQPGRCDGGKIRGGPPWRFMLRRGTLVIAKLFLSPTMQQRVYSSFFLVSRPILSTCSCVCFVAKKRWPLRLNSRVTGLPAVSGSAS